MTYSELPEAVAIQTEDGREELLAGGTAERPSSSAIPVQLVSDALLPGGRNGRFKLDRS